jgi:energy-converting hydrogenase Eha subunit A
MVAPLFAMEPPDAFATARIGALFLCVVIGIFVLTANRKGNPQSERNRRAGLGLLAIFCGPLFGAGLAALTIAVGDVPRLDVAHTYYVFTVIGAFAGFVTGVAFAVTCVFSPQVEGASKSPATSPEPWDEL